MANFRKGLVVVVSTIILGIITNYVYDLIKGTAPRDFWSVLWSPFAKTFAWLGAPAHLTHFEVLLVLAVVAVIIRRVSSGARIDIENHERRLQKLEGTDKPRLKKPPQNKVADGFEPNQLQMLAARALDECYPRRLLLPDVAAAMQLIIGVNRGPFASQGVIAREMEDLQRKGVVLIDDPDSPMAYYGLTRHGRDFMIEKSKTG